MERWLERRLSFGSASAGSHRQDSRGTNPNARQMEGRSSAINYPGHPRFWPRVAFKMVATSDDMEERSKLLANLAVVVTEEVPVGLRSKEELKEISQHYFGIRKHEFSVYRSYPDTYIAIFSQSSYRDVVYVAGRLVDGPIELRFHAWDLDRFGDRVMIPFHVKLSIERIPQHTWFQDVVEKVLCDEASIHDIEEETSRRMDQRAYRCWTFTKDPSAIPLTVYLTLAKHDPDLRRIARVHFMRPRKIKFGCAFRVLIHIDAVEDLMLYHYPREELIQDDRVPWRDFHWQYGRADGDIDEEDLLPATDYCRPELQAYRCHEMMMIMIGTTRGKSLETSFAR